MFKKGHVQIDIRGFVSTSRIHKADRRIFREVDQLVMAAIADFINVTWECSL